MAERRTFESSQEKLNNLARLAQFYNRPQTNKASIPEEGDIVNEDVQRRSNDFVTRGYNLINNIYEQELLLQQQNQQSSRQDEDDIVTDFSQVSGENTVANYDVEIFINEMEGFPCLWNTSTRSHHDQNMRKTAWQQLATKFGKPVEFLKAQWKNLRDSLKRCLVRRAELTRSGAAAHTLPKCKYFSQLQFVQDKVMNKETSSNVSMPPPSPITSDGMMSPSSSLSENHEEENLDSTSSSIEPIPKKPRQSQSNKRPRVQAATEMDVQFLKTLEDINSTTRAALLPNDAEDDEDMLFAKSIVPTLRKLAARKNKIAKLKIQTLLFELEFDETA